MSDGGHVSIEVDRGPNANERAMAIALGALIKLIRIESDDPAVRADIARGYARTLVRLVNDMTWGNDV